MEEEFGKHFENGAFGLNTWPFFSHLSHSVESVAVDFHGFGWASCSSRAPGCLFITASFLFKTVGALTIVGPLELLQQMPLDHVRRAANRLLRPWRDDRGSVGSVGSVLVTSPAGVPRGKRHRFRVTAQEFRPDPLNQPGGAGLRRRWARTLLLGCECGEPPFVVEDHQMQNGRSSHPTPPWAVVLARSFR